MTTLSHDQLRAHALAWIDDWNRRDVSAVLAAYADDALFVSALAQPYTGGTRVQGKDALRRYWLAALADSPDLRFELISAICDVEAQTVVVHYVAQAGGGSHGEDSPVASTSSTGGPGLKASTGPIPPRNCLCDT